MLTIQEAFNKAYLGVMKQGRASVNAPGRSCLYRGPDGAKCAVGFLIADEHYDYDIENYPIDTKEVAEPLLKSGVRTRGSNEMLRHELVWAENMRLMLSRLQGCHDNLGQIEAECGLLGAEKFRARFKKAVAFVAADYNLTVPEFTE